MMETFNDVNVEEFHISGQVQDCTRLRPNSALWRSQAQNCAWLGSKDSDLESRRSKGGRVTITLLPIF